MHVQKSAFIQTVTPSSGTSSSLSRPRILAWISRSATSCRPAGPLSGLAVELSFKERFLATPPAWCASAAGCRGFYPTILHPSRDLLWAASQFPLNRVFT